MADRKVFTLSQVNQHKSKEDCWVVIDGRVLNVTKFLDEHPGGEEVILETAGKDVTKEFDDIGHSKAAKGMLVKYQVGVLPGYVPKETGSKDAGDTVPETKSKGVSAFVIKDNGKPKLATFLEFFVPLLVAGSYFSYRYVSRIVS